MKARAPDLIDVDALGTEGRLLLLSRMLLGRARNRLGPMLDHPGWQVSEQGDMWMTYPMGKPDTEVRYHETLSEALQRAGRPDLARILDEAADRIILHECDRPIGTVLLPKWPPSPKALQKVLKDQGMVTPQEFRVHPEDAEELFAAWTAANDKLPPKNRSLFSHRHRPIWYVRVLTRGKTRGIIEVHGLDGPEYDESPKGRFSVLMSLELVRPAAKK